MDEDPDWEQLAQSLLKALGTISGIASAAIRAPILPPDAMIERAKILGLLHRLREDCTGKDGSGLIIKGREHMPTDPDELLTVLAEAIIESLMRMIEEGRHSRVEVELVGFDLIKKGTVN